MPKPLRAGLVLSRVPVVTPEPPTFLKKYYEYMSELEKRLMWTFPAYFYFKRGTLAQHRFNDLQRGPVPRHAGVWYPRGIPDVHHDRERRFKQNVVLPRGERDQAITPQPRVTEDLDKNPQTLARKLDKTLFLLICTDGKEWRFPSFEVQESNESLHEAAERGLRELGGENINTWTVSNTPAAVLRDKGIPEFLIKSHVLHGKFAPHSGDFRWLSKDEIKNSVSPEYYAKVESLL